MEEIAHIFVEAADTMGVRIEPHQEALFRSFLAEIIAWNRKINLIARTSPAQIVIRHFLDSLTPVPFIARHDGTLLDIGAGAGFPGIPLKIAIPTLRVHLLEASRKKTSFLKHVNRVLSLEGITVIHKRVEETLQEEMYRGRFDTVISRAAYKLPELTGMAGYFLVEGGMLAAMKGVNIAEELAAATPAAAAAGLVLEGCHRFDLPITGDPRQIVIYRKT